MIRYTWTSCPKYTSPPSERKLPKLAGSRLPELLTEHATVSEQPIAIEAARGLETDGF